MTFRMPPRPTPPRMPAPLGRTPRRLLLGLAVLLVLVVAVGIFVNAYTDLLWFRSVGFAEVFTTRLRTQVVLFAVFGVAASLVTVANVVIAHRVRPVLPLSQEQQTLERYRGPLLGHPRVALAVVAGFVLLITGPSAASNWRVWLLWRNAVPFGTRDPQFGRDISYFTFTYPFQRFLVGFGFFVLALSLVAGLLAHYLLGGVRLQSTQGRFTPAARAHLSVLLGLFTLLKAYAYWLDRFGLMFSHRGFVDTGASYTDVKAVLPAKAILIAVAIICAGLFFANLFSRGWLLPAAGFGLLVFAAVVIGGVYPAVVQRLQVKPSEVSKERPYIRRHIDATRAAYGLLTGRDVLYRSYSGTANGSADTTGDDATLGDVRLLDPARLTATYQQLQGFKGFYSFPDTLDVDRYTLHGTAQEQVVAVRDIDTAGLAANQRNWINTHLVYTHGYGLVSAPSDTVDADGKPRFDEGDIPASGSLGLTQPRVYFGENSPTYSVVGGPPGSSPQELDYTTSDGSQRKNTYRGGGGVSIGSPFHRLLYALRFGEKNLLLSSGVNADSRILYLREPRQRVQKVAPWLTVDGDPYPAVVDGRIQWIVDGYTTSDAYPYSERRTLGDVTADTLTTTSRSVAAQRQAQVNYIRNSVKAVVDAYTGKVTLYAWGGKDPVRDTWERAFPGLVKPTSAIPAALERHFRYPEDLFKVQRELLTRFHITDPGAFYNGSDYWLVPKDPTNEGTDQPPYYLTLALPGETGAQFRLTSPLLANNDRTLASFVSVDSDPSSPDYGKLQVLQLPSNTQVNGPGQVANLFESYPKAATQLSLLRRGGSSVELGNLLTLPLTQGVLYVEPIYVKSTGSTSFPLLKQVIASYQGKITYQGTLSQALSVLFGSGAASTPGSGGGGPGTGGGTGSASGPELTRIRAAIAAADQAYRQGQTALRKGDFAGYGRAQATLQRALATLSRLTTGSTSASPSPAPSPSPSPSAGPSPAARPSPSPTG